MASNLLSGTTAPRGLPRPELIRWQLLPAREIFKLEYGKALVESARRPGTVPVYGTNGRCGAHDEALFKGPGVILGRKGQGPLGVEWCDDDYWVIDTAYSLVPIRPDVDLKYAYFLIKHVGLNHLKDGTSNPTLSRDTFGAQALPLPPMKQQRAIAQVLSSLDDKIELNRRMNETLEAMAQALFKSWFVDFDPVCAKAEGRDPGLPSHIAHLFPGAFEESELKRLPKGWVLNPISDFAQIVGGSTPSTKESEFWDGGIHHFATPKDLANLTVPLLLNTERRITDKGLSQISSGLLPPGTVLLSSRAPIGYLAICEVATAINQGFIALVPNSGVSNLFLLWWAKSALEEIHSRANGSTFAEISKANFRPILVQSPTDDLMAMFERVARPIYSRILAGQRETQLLSQLRDALLPKLISGELRIKDAERFIERAGA